MTSSPTTDSERMTELDARFTPQRVDLNLHGGSHTLTYLLDGQYYTAERIRPDFPKVSDDAKLTLTSRDCPEANELRKRRGKVAMDGAVRSAPSTEERCESDMILDLLGELELTFGGYFQKYLLHRRLDDVEPTNKSYYEAKKTFTTVWLRLAEIIAGE